MSDLIEEILNYAWATNDAAGFEMIDMHVCIEGVLSDLAHDIKRTGARISIGPMDDFEGITTQIRMLLQNLISNSIKFQEPGNIPRVHVSCQKMDAGKEILIAVKDNGIGIEPEFHERIFGLFQRLHLREVFPGTGLGLTTCHRIVRNHMGTISLHSAPGAGSTFEIRIPLNVTARRNHAERKVA